LHHSHGGCPILAFFARVGGDAAGATLVRSTPPVVYAVVVPALFAYAKTGDPHLWWLLQFESRATRAIRTEYLVS
jgi:hypothetical protein